MTTKPYKNPMMSSKRDGELRGDQVGILVRKLMAQVGGRKAVDADVRARREDSPPDGSVILECEVDGVRCVLSRAARTDAEVPLSPREREIVDRVAKGYPNKTIADELDISIWTVSTHLRRIFAKYRVTSRAAMVAQFVAGK